MLLAGCNRRNEAGAEDDGILTGMQIVGTDLRGTELVVLSACQSGLATSAAAKVWRGCGRPFSWPGRRGVVATLWRIPDQETAYADGRRFRQFVERPSQGTGAARGPPVQMIKARRGAPAAHPFVLGRVYAHGRIQLTKGVAEEKRLGGHLRGTP